MSLQKKITMYELYSVSRNEKEEPVTKLEDVFIDMEDAVKQAHILMDTKAVATKIHPKQYSAVKH